MAGKYFLLNNGSSKYGKALFQCILENHDLLEHSI